ncbi:MAG: hypothetical protein ACKN9V_06400 [Pseudomonadota bacterium]
MIKSLITQAIKICLVLAIGQIPMGRSTVGGEFISTMKYGLEKSAGPKTVDKVTSFFESLREHSPQEEIREISSKTKIDLKKLKAWVPGDELEKEESEEINKVLERD